MIECIDDLKESLASSISTTDTADDTERVTRIVSSINDLLAEIEERQQSDDYYASEEAHFDCDALAAVLDQFTPPYAYFGTHPGDGADLGFWLDIDQLAEDQSRDDLPDYQAVTADYCGYSLDVSDHGNMSLIEHDGKGSTRSIWSVA
jgi:hypothetical protein